MWQLPNAPLKQTILNLTLALAIWDPWDASSNSIEVDI
jgi:hypothetical protein